MKLRFTPRAMNDLTAIRRFIRDEYGNPKAAKRITDSIFAQCANLKQFPQSGTALSARFEIDTDVRYLVCEGYMIFYRIEGEFVSVGAVIHGKNDKKNFCIEKPASYEKSLVFMRNIVSTRAVDSLSCRSRCGRYRPSFRCQ